MRLDPDEKILLTTEEYERMLEIIANPPEPSEHMLEAVNRYKKRVKNETKT